ncbi:hypothetical protein [Rathayibacter sp. AY1D9]|uniref:hypothetical protein n=1 Tax=Rathayibacter sp. AY1D9 TaxID=2080548 RepID=UPI000CE8EB28|nr:hypothetical protein [Rathayibacter sp. AY1D9]PPH83919.1 hypothetical protein C5C50_04260 [Rathayibacter sp. AY1D9]
MTDFAQLITILLTATVTFAVTLLTTVINRRFARADERQVYERNSAREDALRFERDTVRLVTELLSTTEQIFDRTVSLRLISNSTNVLATIKQSNELTASRMQLMMTLKVQLTECMLLAPTDITVELNRVVAACNATMDAKQPDAQIRADRYFIDAKSNLIGHMRSHLGVEDVTLLNKKSTH